MMSQDKVNSEITIRKQMKKFAIKSMYGFQTIIVYGMGKRLGIFNYLYDKAKSKNREGKISSISFNLEELSDNLNLHLKYLDAWLHMALECGIFEIDDSCEQCAKTAPYIYDLLIDRKHKFYIGGTISNFYKIALYQDLMVEGFKTGKIRNLLDLPAEDNIEAQQSSARVGVLIERLFAKRCNEDRKKLTRGAMVLEVGCGYGFNLEIWANKYKKAEFIGIDIDSNGVKYAKTLIDKYNWKDRVEIMEIALETYAETTDTKFDFILLNQVLHEMDPDEIYRLNVLKNIYSLLRDDGLLIVVESMIPDTFAPKKQFQLYDVMHKLLEVGFGSRFYDEKSFKELIDLSPFTRAELIRERGDYFWAIRK